MADFQSGFQTGFQGIAAGGPQSYSYTASGGIAFAGAAPAIRKAARTPTGGIQLGGAASVLHKAVRNAAGGLVLAGAAAVSFVSGTQTRVVTAVGGIIFGGAAAIVRNTRRVASGGILLSGAAAFSTGVAGHFRALILVGGLLRLIPDADLGTGKKPIVYIASRLRQRQVAEGTPIVLANGRIRLLQAGETLDI